MIRPLIHSAFNKLGNWERLPNQTHRHLLWAHQMYSSNGFEHISRVIVARNWFIEHVWPVPLYKLIFMVGFPRGGWNHPLVRLVRSLMDEGAEYKWRMFILKK